MNKEDKKFINDRVQRAENALKQFVHDQADDSKTELRSEMQEMKTELSEQIRFNGLKIEQLTDVVQSIAESNIVIQRDVSHIIKRLDAVNIDELPVIRSAVSDHSRRITRLEKARAR